MDLGIIAAWKKGYRKILLRAIIADIESRAERRELNRGLKSGMKGICEGFDPHMLDVARMAKDAWDLVRTETAARCWVKSQILPTEKSATVTSIYGKMKSTYGHEDLRFLKQALEKLSLNLPHDDDVRIAIDFDAGEREIASWFEVEDDSDVQEAIVDDATRQIDEISVIELAHETQQIDEEGGGEGD